VQNLEKRKDFKMRPFTLISLFVAMISVAAYCYATPQLNICWDPAAGSLVSKQTRLNQECDNVTACGSSMLCGNEATVCPGQANRPWRKIDVADISAVGECVPYGGQSCQHCGPPAHADGVGIVCLRMRAFSFRNALNHCQDGCPTQHYVSRAGCQP
jgi:hypothetical protein